MYKLNIKIKRPDVSGNFYIPLMEINGVEYEVYDIHDIVDALYISTFGDCNPTQYEEYNTEEKLRKLFGLEDMRDK